MTRYVVQDCSTSRYLAAPMGMLDWVIDPNKAQSYKDAETASNVAEALSYNRWLVIVPADEVQA